MRVLVCGARDYDDKSLLFSTLDDLAASHDFEVVIEGGARGADTLAREWAELRNIPIEEYRANWKEYGRAAGPIRNKQMLNEGHPDMVVAFPKTVLTESRGTKDMVKQATKARITTIVVEHWSDRINTHIL